MVLVDLILEEERRAAMHVILYCTEHVPTSTSDDSASASASRSSSNAWRTGATGRDASALDAADASLAAAAGTSITSASSSSIACAGVADAALVWACGGLEAVACVCVSTGTPSTGDGASGPTRSSARAARD